MCEACVKKCPNIYTRGLRELPEKWRKPVKSPKEANKKRKDMRADSVAYYSVELLNTHKTNRNIAYSRLLGLGLTL